MKVAITGGNGMIGRRLLELAKLSKADISFVRFDPRSDEFPRLDFLLHLGENPVSEKDPSLVYKNIATNKMLHGSFPRVVYISSRRVEEFLRIQTMDVDEYVVRKLTSECIYLSSKYNRVLRVPTICDPFALRQGTLIYKIAKGVMLDQVITLDYPDAKVAVLDIDIACMQILDIVKSMVYSDEGQGGLFNLKPTISMKAVEVLTVFAKLARGEDIQSIREWLLTNNCIEVGGSTASGDKEIDDALGFAKKVLVNG